MQNVLKLESNLAAVDLGNAIFQALINGEEFTMPNALADCVADNIDYYDPEKYDLDSSLIVEVDSGSLHNKREKQFVGISATNKENYSSVDSNNKKTDNDRTLKLLFTILTKKFVQETDESNITVEYDLVSTALPTKQVKQDREKLKEKIIGNHTVTYKHIPNRKDVKVNLVIHEAIVSTEGAAAFIALTRDDDTLQVKDASLLNETVLIADIGGDSFDPVGIQNGNIIEDKDIVGVAFGINRYLDRIIDDVESEIGFRFSSRYTLEERLAKGKSQWYVVFDQNQHDITPIVEKHFRELANRFIEEVSSLLKVVTLQEVTRIFAVGGPIKIAKDYFEEANNKRTKPLKITFAEDLEKLNLKGLGILAKAQSQLAKVGDKKED